MALEGLHIGQYRLVRLLGSGGMGEVYLAEDERINQQVAIKVSRTEADAYPSRDAGRNAARLFQREARAIARLEHPNILPLFSYDEIVVNGMVLTYIIMPYRPEGSFAHWLQQHTSSGLLPVQDVVFFISQAADALQYAHDNQVIHQDVKPANFLIHPHKGNINHPDLLLADFGIAKLSSATSGTSQTVRGTPRYMAPEQWSGEPVPATDQYALAVMAYELLTGHSPFSGRSEQVMYQHMNVQPQPPGIVNPQLSTDIDAVILKALAKRPEDRFPSISSFANALQQAIENTSLKTHAANTRKAGNIQATLAISKAEAQRGSQRTLTLPDGRKVTISVPAGTYDGQLLTIKGMGRPSQSGSATGDLLLRLSVKDTENIPSTSSSQNTDRTVPVSRNNGITRTVASHNTPLLVTNAGTSQKKRVLSGRNLLLIGVVFLIVIAALGFYYIPKLYQPTPNNNVNTIATVHAIDATNFAATATRQANNTSTTPTITVTSQPTNTTVTPNVANPYPPNIGTLVLNDPLTDNNQGYSWDTQPTQFGTCTFTTEGYHAAAPGASTYHRCMAQNTNFGNFAFEVNMTITSGDCGLILFRGNASLYHYYYFHVCQDGTYALWLFSHSGNQSKDFLDGSDSIINRGTNQTNLIAVVTNNNTITLYINHKAINQIQDSTYSQGQIGLGAENVNGPTEVVYTNARVWEF